jgi:opacity protein-like surface antigen
MKYHLTINVLLFIFLLGSSAAAQMSYKPLNGDFSLDLAKKKDKKADNKKNQNENASISQEIRAGLGFFTGFPVSDFNYDVYTGYGVNVEGEYFINPALSVGLSTGYHSYKYDEIHFGIGHYSMIPVMARGAYYFMEGDFHPFAGLNAGVFLAKSKYDSVVEPRSYLDPQTQLFVHKPGYIKPINKNSTVFGLTPVAGIVFKPYESVWLNCNLRYNLMFAEEKNLSSIGIHLGLMYSFGF